jgi:hypothetical protein
MNLRDQGPSSADERLGRLAGYLDYRIEQHESRWWDNWDKAKAEAYADIRAYLLSMELETICSTTMSSTRKSK